MIESLYRRNTCRLCESRNVELVVSLTPTPVADAYISADLLGEKQETYPLDLFLCLNCGHVQLLDVVNPEILFRNYTYESSISLGLVEHFRKYADEMLNNFDFPEDSLVIDIGSNDGSQLRFFKERGMRVLGIDPAVDIARKASEAGIETLPVFFTAELADKIRNERGPAVIITANNVFAHADNLSDIAQGIRILLAPDGIFTFEVSYLLDILEKYLFDTVYHEHLCYHSVKPMDTFLRRHGLELIDIERISSKAGSLRATVQLANGPRKVMPSVETFVSLEAKFGLDRPETFTTFAAAIESVKNQLGDMLQDLKSQDKTIVGYGASATVTTLIYYFDLGSLLDFIVDDNPLKENLLSPGHHIPVLPSQTLYERKPDYVIILAWNYSQPIIKKHQAFLDQGGHFIVPLPEVKVV